MGGAQVVVWAKKQNVYYFFPPEIHFFLFLECKNHAHAGGGGGGGEGVLAVKKKAIKTFFLILFGAPFSRAPEFFAPPGRERERAEKILMGKRGE